VRWLLGVAVAAAAAGAVAWGLFVSSGWLAGEVRQVFVTRLGQSLGRPVALGGVAGDPWRGIELRDLVIAEPGGFAQGVVFSADRIRLSINVAVLVLHPGSALQSISRVDLVNPRVAVARSASGVWNLASLLTHEAQPLGPEFRGRITVSGGIVGYTDGWESAQAPFATRFSGVSGTLDFLAGRQIAFDLAGHSADGEQATLHGEYLADDGIYDLDVSATNGDAKRWGDYLVRLRQVRWAGGRFDARAHLLVSRSTQGMALDYSAAVRVRDGAAEYLPTGVHVRDVSGDLTLRDGGATTTGLSFVANGSPVRVRGDVGYPSRGPTWLDLVVTSPRLDLGMVRTLFFPRASLALAGQASGGVWITGPAAAPSLDGGVESAQGRFNQEAFADLRTQFQYGGGLLAFRGLSARVGGGQVKGDGILGVSGETSSYTFATTAANVDLDALPRLGIPLPGGVTGRASGDIVGVETQGRTRLLASVTMPSGVARGVSFEDMRALFWDDAGIVDVDFLSVRRGDAAAYASGTLTTAGGVDLAVSAYALPLDEVPEWAGLTAKERTTLDLAGQANLEGRLGGTVQAPVISGTVSAWDGRVGKVPFDLAEGNIALSATNVRSSGLELRRGTTSYRMRGGVTFAPLSADALSIDAEGVPAALLAPELAPGVAVAGTLSGHVAAEGPASLPTVSGALEFADGSVAGQRIDAASVRFAGLGRRFDLQAFEARVSDSRLDASGTIDLDGALDLHVSADHVQLTDFPALQELGFAARGTVALSGDVVGTVRDPDLRATLNSPALRINGQTFQASGTIEYRDRTLKVSSIDLAQRDERYGVTGELAGGAHPTADLTFRVQHGQIATILSAAAIVPPVPVAGTIDGTVELQGALADAQVHLVLSMQDGQVGGVPIGTGNADLTLQHGTVDIQTLELHPVKGTIAAKGRFELRGTSAVEVSGQGIDANMLRPLFRMTPTQSLAGTLDFTIQWGGTTQDPTAGLSLEAVNAGIPGAVADRVVALAYYKGGVVNIQDATVEKGTHKLIVQGTLPVQPGALGLAPNGPLSLHLSLQDTDLSLLTLLTPQIQDGSGTITGDVSIGGTVADPQMSGVVQSQGGRFRFVPVTTPIENLNADITFSQSEVVVRTLSATVGGGTVQSQGTVAIKNLRPDMVALSLTAKGVTLAVPGLYSGGVDATLALAGEVRRPTLAGTVTLSRGTVALANGVGPGAVEGAPVGLDVIVVLGSGVVYAQGPARADLDGAIHIGGTLAKPAVSGRIQSLNGTIAILGTPYNITSGTLIFSEASGLDPQIAVLAQAVYGGTRVFLDISGVLPTPTLTWSSDPPLSEDKILALVAGTTGAEGSPASLLSQVLLGSISQSLQRVFRLDVLTISYDTQNPLTLQIGKYIFRNFYVSLSEILGRPAVPSLPAFGTVVPLNPTGQAYTVVGVQYYLSPTVSVAYNVDTLGDSGVFLVTRIPF